MMKRLFLMNPTIPVRLCNMEIPSREWLMGWLRCWYHVQGKDLRGLNKASREWMYKKYLTTL